MHSKDKLKSDEPKDQAADIEEISKLTPFSKAELKGQVFARGNMLGGANPLEAAGPAPWKP